MLGSAAAIISSSLAALPSRVSQWQTSEPIIATQRRIIGCDLQHRAVLELDDVNCLAPDLALQGIDLQQALTVSPQDRSLLLVGAEQDNHRLFAGRKIFAPIGAGRGAPNCDGTHEAVFATAPADQQDEAAQCLRARGGEKLGATGALPKEIDLALLGQRKAVNQLGQCSPGLETRCGEGLAEQGRRRQRFGQGDLGREGLSHRRCPHPDR